MCLNWLYQSHALTKMISQKNHNAANSKLAGGAGVDGGIHRAGGPSIMEKCKKLGGCPTGQGVITTGGNLKATYVIHTVEPIYQGEFRGEFRGHHT